MQKQKFRRKHSDKSDKSSAKHRKKKPGDRHHHHQRNGPAAAAVAGAAARLQSSGRQPATMQLLANLASAAATIDPVELEPNASRFAIFAAVRAAVLESDAKLSQILCSSRSACCSNCAAACKLGGGGGSVDCRCHSGGGGIHATVARLANGGVGGGGRGKGGAEISGECWGVVLVRYNCRNLCC